MSIIAVDVRLKERMGLTVRKLAKSIKGNFDIMKSQRGLKVKTCFVRLSEVLDPLQVIETLKKDHFKAYIPNDVPNLPPVPKKKGRLQLNTRLALGIRVDENLTVVIKNTHAAILEELQYKYTMLYSMSQLTNHQLLEAIAQIILDRLKELLSPEPKSAFDLSLWYRRVFPHSGDFQLVQDALHVIQDAAGTARTNLQEKGLIIIVGSDEAPKMPPFHRMRMYGEPYLPKKETLIPLMKRYRVNGSRRSDHLFNLLEFQVTSKQFSRVMKLNSTSVEGMKLIVRSADMTIYQPQSASIRMQISEMAGETQEEDEEYLDLEDEEYNNCY